MKFCACFLLFISLCSGRHAIGMDKIKNPIRQAGSMSDTAVQIRLLEDERRNLSPEEAYSNYISGQFKLLKGQKYNAGFTRSVYWLLLKIPAKKIISAITRDSLFFVIGNAHINNIRFYTIASGKLQLKYETGDYFKFKQRPKPCRLFVFPIPGAPDTGNDEYLLRIDKHNESLQLSAELLNSNGFYQKTAGYNLINGILLGAVLLLFTFGFFLFMTVRDKLYLYYILYIAAMCLWVIADKGYGFQYIWPDSVYFASRARPVFNALMTIATLQFMQSFIGQDQTSRLFKPIFILKAGFGLLTLLFLVPIHFSSSYYSTCAWGLLLGMLILNGLACLAILWSVIEKIRKKNKEAWFYLISISALIFFGLAEIFVHAGAQEITNLYLAAFGIQAGLIIEAVILIFGLAYRFNSYRFDREKLLIALNKKQQEITASIIDTQENERRKISSQLHDDVGGMLSVATWHISSVLNAGEYVNGKAQEKLETAMEVIKSISIKIRTLGHTLSPWAIQKYGLNKAMTDLVYQINLSEQTALEYVIIGFESATLYPFNFLNDIYRIVQELLNNVLKHAQASNAYLELIEHETMISIIVEDNGKGIDQDINGFSDGIGLDSIRSKVAYFNGKMEIRKKPEHGTIVLIEIPYGSTGSPVLH